MSVKRWKETESWGFTEGDCMAVMEECADGEYVLYSDYAILKAEVERLRKFNDEALAHIAKEERKSRERLDMAEAEVERLRKAGDALAETLEGAGFDSAMDFWNAAKEGKQP